MNIKKESDFIIKVKTPTTLISKHVSLGGDKNNNRRSVSENSKLSKQQQQSSQSLSYSDSFDSDSPTAKYSTMQKAKRATKTTCQANSMQTKKPKKNSNTIVSLPKAGECAQKLLEANQLEINQLMSENADLRRQLFENANELKTVQNQNKIQERYLNKVNSRDADVPNLISRYNSEIHSLQEQLRRKKEKLDVSVRQKSDLDLELAKAKKKIEKFKSLVDDRQLQEREELSKKLLNLTEMYETEVKKNSDLERSIELMVKKHNYQLTVEGNKYKELKQTYNDILLELKNTRSSLKEKTKLLEMQNIYSKRVVRAPHRLLKGNEKPVELEDSNFVIPKITTMPPLKVAIKREEKPQNELSDQYNMTSSSNTKDRTMLKKYNQNSVTAVKADSENDKKLEENKKQNKSLFYGDTPPEISEVEEKSNSKFSEIFEAVRRNMHSEKKVSDTKENDTHKTELLAKLKKIDENKTKKSSNYQKSHFESVEQDLQNLINEANNSESDDLDVFCTSESENGESSNKKSDSSSPCLIIPRGHAGLMASKRNQNREQKKENTQFEFLGFSLNSNNSNMDGNMMSCRTTEPSMNYLTADYEDIKID